MLIGLVGKKGSGKDTLSNYIKEKYNFKQYAFADPLKETLMVLFGFTYQQMYDQDYKEVVDSRWGITPREAMQIFGTEIIQKEFNRFFPNLKTSPREFWVERFKQNYQKNKLENQLNKNLNHEDLDNSFNLVVSDIRFLHELKAIQELGGKIIKINRELNQEKNQFTEHLSETELDSLEDKNFDLIINNDSKIEDMYLRFEQFLKENKL